MPGEINRVTGQLGPPREFGVFAPIHISNWCAKHPAFAPMPYGEAVRIDARLAGLPEGTG